MNNDQDCHMASGARLMENWTDDLGDNVIRLRNLLDSLCEIQQEMAGASTIAGQFVLMAAIDIPFQVELFKRLDVSTVVTALDRTDEKTIRKFDEAISYLKDHRGL